MKKAFNYLLVIAAAILSFSCAKNAAEEPVSVPEGFITVKCSIDNPANIVDDNTKVTLINDGSAGKTQWVDGDKVLFRGAKVGSAGGSKYYSYVASAYDVSVDGKTASFDIPVLERRFNLSEYSWRNDDHEYVADLFAAYPATAVLDYTDGNSWYAVTGFKETNHLLLAGHNDTRVDSGLSFIFVNLTGAISFKVDSDGISGGFDSYNSTLIL